MSSLAQHCFKIPSVSKKRGTSRLSLGKIIVHESMKTFRFLNCGATSLAAKAESGEEDT